MSIAKGTPKVVLCGTFRKDIKRLQDTYNILRDLGFCILSPRNLIPYTERQGFVFMKGETYFTPSQIELYHLSCILSADIIWLYAPDGYLGITAAIELAFAKINGIPVFSDNNTSYTPANYLIDTLISFDKLTTDIFHHSVNKPNYVCPEGVLLAQIASTHGDEIKHLENALFIVNSILPSLYGYDLCRYDLLRSILASLVNITRTIKGIDNGHRCYRSIERKNSSIL